ncbi:MAG: polysaccharide deacetylase [Cyclobacteriaceae bacterium]|nr:MAG: polysaccharide deacetylase [Cyclobacteriaceae bacterium]
MSGFFIHHTPIWLQRVFPQFCWNKSTGENVVYLTFDDGPVPEATPLVLRCLKDFKAKATFFCVGENVLRYPDIIQQILDEGHGIGNHTFKHLNGWSTSIKDYLKDVNRCQEILCPYQPVREKPLMRPPYGRLKPKQWQALVKEYEVVMWDVLSGDFSQSIDSNVCLEQSIRHTRAGSVVLFHDSVKTIDKLSLVLPRFLSHFSQLGYSFHSL